MVTLYVQAVADVVKQQAAEARAAAQKEADAAENKRLQSVQRRTSKEVLQQVFCCCAPCLQHTCLQSRLCKAMLQPA